MKYIAFSSLSDYLTTEKCLSSDSLESEVFGVGDTAYKIFHRDFRANSCTYRLNKGKKAELLEQQFSELPCVIAAHSIVVDDDNTTVGLAMRLLVAGKRMDLLLNQSPQPQGRGMFIQSSRILQLIHSHGCICGDATPANYLIDSNGQCFAIDVDSFGIGEFKCDCTNIPTNRFLMSNGLETFEALKRREGINRGYDKLSQLLAFSNWLDKAHSRTDAQSVFEILSDVANKSISLDSVPYLHELVL